MPAPFSGEESKTPDAILALSGRLSCNTLFIDYQIIALLRSYSGVEKSCSYSYKLIREIGIYVRLMKKHPASKIHLEKEGVRVGAGENYFLRRVWQRRGA